MKINKMLTLSFIAIMAVCGVQAQTVDEIVNKHIAAMGGADKLKGLQTMYTEGIMEMRGMEIPLKMWVVNDKAVRIESEVMGSNIIQVVTRNSGWMQVPLQGPEPKEMDAEMVRAFQPRLDLVGSLYDYKSKGRKVTLEGKENAGGAAAYKLKVTNADGTTFNLYVDATTYYIDKMQTRIKAEGKEMDLTILFSDYKKTDNGFVYPSATSQEPVGTKLNITKADVNKPVDDTLFKMPKK